LYVLPVYIWVTGQDSAHQRLVSTIDKTAPGACDPCPWRAHVCSTADSRKCRFLGSFDLHCTLSRRVSASPPSTPRNLTLFNARLIAFPAIPVRPLLAHSLLIWSHSVRILPSSCQILSSKLLVHPRAQDAESPSTAHNKLVTFLSCIGIGPWTPARLLSAPIHTDRSPLRATTRPQVVVSARFPFSDKCYPTSPALAAPSVSQAGVATVLLLLLIYIFFLSSIAALPL
jgi:hypothetical protein